MKSLQKVAEEMQQSEAYKGKILFKEMMSEYTSFKIGGPAEVFFTPSDADSLINLVHILKENNLSWFILGAGSNLVVSDEGFDCAVISTAGIASISMTQMTPDRVMVRCGAGVGIQSFIDFCIEKSLSGSEKFAGLPGSVGGAVYMNARCFDVSISDIFESACYFDVDSMKICEYNFNNLDWDYKKSPFQTGNKIILRADFNLIKKAPEESSRIATVCNKYIEERYYKGHFKYPSAGSVFKNNHNFGAPSGKIIDDCGLRGHQIGGAQVAPFHGNFIVNLGNATQKDVKALVDFVVNKVEAEKGFKLEPEIIFCGK